MIDEIFDLFLLDGEMRAIMSCLLAVFTAFNIFLLYKISLKIYAILAGLTLGGILLCAFLCTVPFGWDSGIGFLAVWAAEALIPLFVSQGIAFIIFRIIKSGRTVRITSLTAAIILIAAACVFWPKPLELKIGNTAASDVFYYYDGETYTEKKILDKTHLKNVVSQINCMPCIFTPKFGDECIVIKLNENYVLLAERNESSYIFEYSGDIEKFEPENACYKVYRNKPLYISLKTS